MTKKRERYTAIPRISEESWNTAGCQAGNFKVCIGNGCPEWKAVPIPARKKKGNNAGSCKLKKGVTILALSSICPKET